MNGKENFMGTQRTIVTVSDEDKLWLKSYSRTFGISMAEAIRRGIARLKVEEGKSNYESAVRNTRNIWRKGDGLVYQKNMRNEWR
jgi:hypothetical protein